MEMSRQRSCRDVLLIWLVKFKLQERVKRVDTFVRDTSLVFFTTLHLILLRESRKPQGRNIPHKKATSWRLETEFQTL